MEIIRKHSPETLLSNLDYGDVFELDNEIYMFINDDGMHDCGMLPCANLSTGDLKYISEDFLVIPYYDAELKY